MRSNHLILCCPLLLPPSIFPSIRVFSTESVLRVRWPTYWSFSFSISPSNEYCPRDTVQWIVFPWCAGKCLANRLLVGKVLICRSCQFPHCKCSHCDWYKVLTRQLSLNVELGKEAQGGWTLHCHPLEGPRASLVLICASTLQTVSPRWVTVLCRVTQKT